jgi:hypothetical protein
MSPSELCEKKEQADLVLRAVRDAGCCVLRVVKGDHWRLMMINGSACPPYLRQKLIELQPYVMILLREICYDTE